MSSLAVGALSASWLPASDDSTPAAGIRYQIHASTDANFTPGATTLKFEGTGISSANIASGFTPGSRYSVRLVVIDSQNASSVSDALQATIADTTATLQTGVSVATLQTTEVAQVNPDSVTLQAGVAAPAVGQYIASAEGDGYLRKVTAVTASAGGDTLQTAPASINEALSDVQVSSSFKMVSVPTEIITAPVQAGLIVSAPVKSNTPGLISWPQTGLRYSVVPQTAAAVPGHQAGAAALATASQFTRGADKTVNSSWAKVIGPGNVQMFEGAYGEIKLNVATTRDDNPWLSSTPVNICKFAVDKIVSTGIAGNPSGISVSLGLFEPTLYESATGRIKAATQTISISAAAGTAYAAPYRATVIAYLDDLSDGCSGNTYLFRDAVYFDIDILVVNDTFPSSETTTANFTGNFTGSASFNIANTVTTSFEPILSFDKTISGGKLTYARIAVQASPKAVQQLTITATAKGTMDVTKPIITPRKFFKVYVTPSGIPIVISGEFKLDMRITGDVSGALDATELFTIGYDRISYGFTYQNGVFTPVEDIQPVYNLKIGGKGKAEANLQISLLPSMKITAYEAITGKVVLEPYLASTAGVEGFVQFEADIDANAHLLYAADADYRLTKGQLSGGVRTWLYADLHIWDTVLLAWPSAANEADYTTYEKFDLIAETPILGIPALSAAADYPAIHPSDTRAIKVAGTATSVPNPLKTLFSTLPDTYIPWLSWTAPRIIAPFGTATDSYQILPSPTHQENEAWVRLTQPGTYTVRLGGFAAWGSWARQYTEVQIVVADGNSNGIIDRWETKYGLSGTGAAIAAADPDGDGASNLQEWQTGTDPLVAGANLLPIASFTQAAVNNNVVFDASASSDSDGTIASYAWDFGDGISGTGVTAAHSYTSSGAYIVTLTVTDNRGGSSSASQIITLTASNNPTQTASIAQILDDAGAQTGPLAQDAQTDDNSPALSGSLSAALTVTQTLRVYDGNAILGAASVNSTSWSFVPSPALPDGPHSFTVAVAGADGLEGLRSAAWSITVSTATAPTGALPDTGITASQCYQAGSDVLVSCASAGALALNDKQDGMIGRDVSSPNNADGKLGFSYSAVSGGCVKDNLTGLTWEVKTTDGGLRDWNKTYTNYDDTTQAQKWNGSAYVNPTQSEIDAASNSVGYIAAVNAVNLCGYSNWRLPTARELQSLVDYSVAYPGPTIDTIWFPNTQGSYYWSSSPYSGYAGNAWVVYFGYGFVSDLSRGDSGYVRLVR